MSIVQLSEPMSDRERIDSAIEHLRSKAFDTEGLERMLEDAKQCLPSCPSCAPHSPA